ncbi:MAG TPA: hypothetical protein VNY84_02170, partial [Acidimicrobiales bacterium]|nr:hypothetical protein [Acidimicrobiales bacterium]
MEPDLPPRPIPPAPPVPPVGPAAAAPGRVSTGSGRGRRQRSGLGAVLRNNIVLFLVAAIVLGVGGVALATGEPSRPSVDLTSAPAMPASSPAAAGSPAGSSGAGA